MDMKEAMEKRHMVRKYTDEPLKEDMIKTNFLYTITFLQRLWTKCVRAAWSLS